jgi:hypothetical protein
MKKLTLPFFLTALLLAGCRKNPIEKLNNPVLDGVVPQNSGTVTNY